MMTNDITEEKAPSQSSSARQDIVDDDEETSGFPLPLIPHQGHRNNDALPSDPAADNEIMEDNFHGYVGDQLPNDKNVQDTSTTAAAHYNKSLQHRQQRRQQQQKGVINPVDTSDQAYVFYTDSRVANF